MKLSVNWESLTTRLTRPETNVLICSQCASLGVSNRLGWLLVCWKRDVPPHSNDHDQRCSNGNEAGGLDANMIIIHELTTEIHDALSKKDILKVEFEWIRYMFRSFSSSPGFYAGINITWNGKPSHCKSKDHISTYFRRLTYSSTQSVYYLLNYYSVETKVPY